MLGQKKLNGNFIVVCLALAFLLSPGLVVQWATAGTLEPEIDTLSKEVEPKVIEWRRDIHKHPELSFQETGTAGLVADHLKSLGIEVKAGVAGTGVIGILKGTSDTPVVALRADMDALPVKEETGLPYASTVQAEYKGKTVHVMHACGHDNHVAILMGTAEVLAKMKDKIPGTVKFIFQPSEEPLDGADRMIKEGALENPVPQAIFGLHVAPYPSKMLAARSGPDMASADRVKITVKGNQTHGGVPWAGVDPIVVSSQIIVGLQTIVSRQANLTRSPLVISIGQIHGGAAYNIIPETVEMEGTIRSFDEGIRSTAKERIIRTAKSIAEASGATAEVTIPEPGCPVNSNNPALFKKMEGTLKRVANRRYMTAVQTTTAEDFAFYSEKIPSLYFFLGINPQGQKMIPNHSPRFTVDESALIVGVRAMANLAVDFLEMEKK